MRLPAAERAFVDPEKVRAYLLSPDHPLGRGKALAFAAAGYSQNAWARLARDLAALAQYGEAVRGSESRFGQKFEIEGIVLGPNGRGLRVRTVWIVRHDEDFPRLITAHPRGER